MTGEGVVHIHTPTPAGACPFLLMKKTEKSGGILLYLLMESHQGKDDTYEMQFSQKIGSHASLTL